MDCVADLAQYSRRVLRSMGKTWGVMSSQMQWRRLVLLSRRSLYNLREEKSSRVTATVALFELLRTRGTPDFDDHASHRYVAIEPVLVPRV